VYVAAGARSLTPIGIFAADMSAGGVLPDGMPESALWVEPLTD